MFFFCIKSYIGTRVKLAGHKSVLTPTLPPPPPPVVYSTDRTKAVAPVLVLLFVALWFILRGDLFCVLPSVILFLCFFRPFSIACLGKRELDLVLFVHLFDLRMFGFDFCLFLFVSGKGCGCVVVALSGFFSHPFFLFYWPF